MSGIERQVDDLGRVVLPVCFRRRMGLRSGDKVLVSLEGSTIEIRTAERRCALCSVKLDDSDGKLCASCIDKIKSDK